jgi:hypothetical protein
MNAERTQAYRRVMGTLEELGPSKLQTAEQERIRHAADTLIFSAELEHDPEAQTALDDAGELCSALVESGRWGEARARRLARDVRECGPERATRRRAA